MATTRNGQLETAVATLITTQAQFVASQAQFMGAVQRIEGRLANIEALLVRHEQILQALPEAIRRTVDSRSHLSKLGFFRKHRCGVVKGLSQTWDEFQRQ